MNKKFLIVGTIIIIIGVIISIIFVNRRNGEIENEVIQLINNLNSGSDFYGFYGDWDNSLHITKVNEVKKIDYNLLDEEDKKELDEESSVFMINLQEETYGDVQIVVVDGIVTANSILGETYEDMWNSDIFLKVKINIDKINEGIE